MTSESKVDQIIATALAEVPNLPLTKDGRDLNGNNSYGLERRVKHAICKILGLNWKQMDNATYQVVFEITQPLRMAISARRNAIMEGGAR